MTQLGAAVHMINRDTGLNIPTRLNTLWNRIDAERFDDKTFAKKVAFTEEIDQDILQFLKEVHLHLSNPTLR